MKSFRNSSNSRSAGGKTQAPGLKMQGLLALGACLLALASLAGCTGAVDLPLKTGPVPAGGRIVVLPIQNLSGTAAPLRDIREMLAAKTAGRGFEVVEEREMERFMARRRLRYTGGIDPALASDFASDLQADAILVTTLENYSEIDPPKVGLFSRLIASGGDPAILWMENASLSGDDSPGILGLGLISDPRILLEKATEALASSMASKISGERGAPSEPGDKFRPKISFRSPVAGRDLREAVIGFAEESSIRGEGETAILKIVLSNPSDRTVTVDYSVDERSEAKDRADYRISAGTLTFEPGQTLRSLAVPLVEDTLYERDEKLVLKLSNPSHAVLGISSHILTIVDNDPLPSLQFASGESTMPEGGAAVVSVELDTPSEVEVRVPFFLGGTAHEGRDFRVVTPSPLTIPAGRRGAAIHLVSADDDRHEGSETVIVELGLPENARWTEPGRMILTVSDNDPPPTVSFAAETSLVQEGKAADVEIFLSNAADRPVKIDFGVRGGSATGKGVDYLLSAGTLAFAPGETRRKISVPTAEDTLHEGDERVVLFIASLEGAVLGQSEHNLAIVDNDPPPVAQFAASAQNLSQWEETVEITVELSAASELEAAVPFTLAGTALTGEDFRPLTASPLLFSPGSRTGTIRLALDRKRPAEKDRTVVLKLESPGNATLGRNQTHTLTLLGRKQIPTMAVVPFFNQSGRKHGGEILLLHLVRSFQESGKFKVIEPGVVRQRLLNFRVIMEDGISLADADVLAHSLGADLILTGKVMDYEDYSGSTGEPRVHFTVMVIERASRKVVWSSRSDTRGKDGVYFFDMGKVNTAGELARHMVRSIVQELYR